MVARDALVVADRNLAPYREHGPPSRRVPGTPRPAHIFRRARIVHGSRTARGSDHGLYPAKRCRDVKVLPVEILYRLVHQVLEKAAQRLFAVHSARGVCVQHVHNLSDTGTRRDLTVGPGSFRLQAVQLLPAPAIGFVEVEHGAQGRLAEKAVTVAAYRVPLGGLACQLRAHPRTKRSVSFGRLGGRRLEVLGEGAVATGVLGGQAFEKRPLTAQPSPSFTLRDASLDLAAGRWQPSPYCLRQTEAVTGKGAGYLGHPSGDVGPVLVGRSGHHVEHLSHRLEGAPDDPYVAQAFAGLVEGNGRA